VTLAARVNEAFGLPGNPVDAALASRHKLESRRALQAAGLAVPTFRAVSLADDPRALSMSFAYPSVVKPLAMSGSRGVIRVNDSCEFVGAFERLRTLMDQPDVRIERDSAHAMLLVESFFQTFTSKMVCDASRSTEVIICISAESHAAVDSLLDKAVADLTTLVRDWA